jgi:hypothetical protein
MRVINPNTAAQTCAAVRRFDTAINAQLLAAGSDAEATRIWEFKCSAKRVFAAVRPETVPDTADAMLRAVEMGGAA